MGIIDPKYLESLIERLKIHAGNTANTAFARSTMSEAVVELQRIAAAPLLVDEADVLSKETSPNTIYMLATDSNNRVVVRGFRSTSNPSDDEHVMTSALELSQAVGRGVKFNEHCIGNLLVRPADQGVQQ